MRLSPRPRTWSALLTAVVLPLVVVMSAAPGNAATRSAPDLSWEPCQDAQLGSLGMHCAMLAVPRDHADPGGDSVRIALVRKPASGPAEQRLGTLVVTVGGPGEAGRLNAASVAAGVPPEVAERYDIVGFDPRGVGASEPAVRCDRDRFAPVRPDPVPTGLFDEIRQIGTALKYVGSCVRAFGDLLPHMTTADNAADIERIRRALGEDRISVIGYGYGSYLGAVYAGSYGKHVDHLVLDSVFGPDGEWYEHGRRHARALNERAEAFFGWIAERADRFGLGAKGAVEGAYYQARAQLADEPAGGMVGPREFDATYLNAGYINGAWPLLAEALARYTRGDEGLLVWAFQQLGAHPDDNDYAVHSATQCSDGGWPRSWSRWRRDAAADHAAAPFLTWLNVWYNAPCAFWPVQAPKSPRVTYGGAALLVQGTDDAGAPYTGAVEMHKRLKRSRLLVIDGEMNHMQTFIQGNKCVDAAVADYLVRGELPAKRRGPDATCAAMPEPR